GPARAAPRAPGGAPGGGGVRGPPGRRRRRQRHRRGRRPCSPGAPARTDLTVAPGVAGAGRGWRCSMSVRLRSSGAGTDRPVLVLALVAVLVAAVGAI